MFTLEEINSVHERFGRMDSLVQYVQALGSLGVIRADSYVLDGHSEFFGKDGYTIVSPTAHERLSIADTSNKEKFLEHLGLHHQGKTSYAEMSKGLADSGIEKWTMDTSKMTIAYYDKAGNEMLVELIS